MLAGAEIFELNSKTINSDNDIINNIKKRRAFKQKRNTTDKNGENGEETTLRPMRKLSSMEVAKDTGIAHNKDEISFYDNGMDEPLQVVEIERV